MAIFDLNIVKTNGQTQIGIGTETTYLITLVNNGPDDSTQPILVSDVIPPQLSFVSATPSTGSITSPAPNLVWTIPAPFVFGQIATLSITATVVGPTGVVQNTATVAATAPDVDTNPNNNSQTDTDVIVCSIMDLTPTTLPDAVVGSAYPSTDITINGGVSPYNINQIVGLPAGISASYDMAGGVITLSGTPIGPPGDYSFTISGTDGAGCPFSQDYTISVLPASTMSTRRRRRRLGGIATIYCDPDRFEGRICPPILTYKGYEYVGVGNGYYVLRMK